MADQIPQSRPWIVQKFGGTSVGKLLNDITGTIIPEYLQSCNVAVVCSARSGTSKSQGTTSLLFEAIHHATSSETSTTELDRVIDIIKDEHLDAARSCTKTRRDSGVDSIPQEDLPALIEDDCETLRGFLKATWTLGEITERTQDRVLAVGEKLSCRIVAASLKSRGIGTELIFLDDIVQQVYGDNRTQQQRAYRQSPSDFLAGLTIAIETKIVSCNGKVPVITGFFGAMPDSLISSVGRGYSDLCAALCAASVDAQELQIWKEVDGIFTADPRKVRSARLLATVTSEEAAELTYYGSEVIHPLTIEQINRRNIPLRLKNVKNPQGSGTIIFPSTTSPRSGSPTGSSTPNKIPVNDSSSALSRSIFMTANGYHGESQYRRTPTAITAKEAITVLNVRSNGRTKPHAFLGEISERIGRHNLTIDLISSSQQMVSLAVSGGTSVNSIDEVVSELDEVGVVTAERHMSIVSVVGHKMRNIVGVAGEVFGALARARVNVHLISQGANEINISFVVRAQDVLLAMDVVHTNVMRIPVQSEQENIFIKGPWLY